MTYVSIYADQRVGGSGVFVGYLPQWECSLISTSRESFSAPVAILIHRCLADVYQNDFGDSTQHFSNGIPSRLIGPFLVTMSAASGTFRGTPNRGGHGRGQVPVFENSPSNIPRPKLESHASSAMQSETGTSTLSASRQKQSKRDEVGHLVHFYRSLG